jgi:hypothetical protein
MRLSQLPESDRLRAPARKIPVMLRTQVLVCGGGPAGTAAAISAARLGVSVTLMERYNHLGGLATGGLVIILPPLTDEGRPIVGGIGLHMRDTLMQDGKAAPRGHEDACWFDPEALKALSVRMCVEAGVDLLHHAWLSDTIVQDGSVRGVVFESKAGTQAALADVVVDTTGDGDVFAWAGCDFEKTDQAIGLDFRLGGVDVELWHAARQTNPDVCTAVLAEVRKTCDWGGPFQISALPSSPGLAWGNNGLRVGDALDPRELSAIDVQARLKIPQALEILRQKMPGFADAWLIDTASQTGVRRSRRLCGVDRLTNEQVAQYDFRHPQAVGRGNDYRRQGIAYDIPYGTLVPESIDGLVTAGRCISCDDGALEPIREIQVCWVTGEAAGTAAALAARGNLRPRDLPITDLQATLREASVAFAD